MRLISDVHGKIHSYLNIIKDCDYSIQLGDMGFNYTLLNSCVDPKKHRFIGGNHDNYSEMPEHAFGDYGMINHGGFEAFFIRGAYSIDRYRRTTMIDWFPQEELALSTMHDAYRDYIKYSPKIVITHECPRFISNMIGSPGVLEYHGIDPKTFTTPTSELLSACWNAWKPDIWVFAHYHKNVDINIDGCQFICMEELGYIDI